MVAQIKKISLFVVILSCFCGGSLQAFVPIVIKSKLRMLAEQLAQEAIKQNQTPSECPICFEPIHAPQLIARCCAAQHLFHKHCLERHLQAQHESGVIRCCPLCRQIIPEDFDFFVWAVERGDMGIVNEFLNAGANVNSHGREPGFTALISAVSVGSIEMAELLLHKGALIDAQDRNGLTPLMYAVLSTVFVSADRAYQMARFLLDHGANPNSATKNGDTALILTARKGDEHFLGLLLDYGAAIDTHGNYGLTALMCAVDYQHAVVMEYLLSRGADINARSQKGCTSLMLAAHHGLTGPLTILLKNGAAINLCDADGDTALSHALLMKQWAIADLLSGCGARLPKKRMIDLAVRKTLGIIDQ